MLIQPAPPKRKFLSLILFIFICSLYKYLFKIESIINECFTKIVISKFNELKHENTYCPVQNRISLYINNIDTAIDELGLIQHRIFAHNNFVRICFLINCHFNVIYTRFSCLLSCIKPQIPGKSINTWLSGCFYFFL